jgi:hypothetical protein
MPFSESPPIFPPTLISGPDQDRPLRIYLACALIVSNVGYPMIPGEQIAVRSVLDCPTAFADLLGWKDQREIPQLPPRRADEREMTLFLLDEVIWDVLSFVVHFIVVLHELS